VDLHFLKKLLGINCKWFGLGSFTDTDPRLCNPFLMGHW